MFHQTGAYFSLVKKTTRSFTVNIIVFATPSGNVARNHFISVCEGVPFLRNPKVFWKTREHVIGIGSETNVCEFFFCTLYVFDWRNMKLLSCGIMRVCA